VSEMAYEVVWVGYSKEPPHLPVCVEKTPELLAEAMGVKLSTVTSTWTKFVRSNKKYARFARVFIEKEDAE